VRDHSTISVFWGTHLATNRGLTRKRIREPFTSLDAERRQQIVPCGKTLKVREQNAARRRGFGARRSRGRSTRVSSANRRVASRFKQLEEAAGGSGQKRGPIPETGLTNLPHASVPVGRTAAGQVMVRRHGREQRAFRLRAHACIGTIGKGLGISRFERAAKMSGARSPADGRAPQARAAAPSFMLELHKGEQATPKVSARFATPSAAGHGNLPKFEQDLLKIAAATGICFPIPTADEYR